MKRRQYTLPSGKVVVQPISKLPIILAILLVIGYISVRITGFDLRVIFNKGNQFFIVLSRMFPPNLQYYNKVLDPLFDTIKMSFLGSFIGALLAFPFAVLSSVNINTNKVSRTVIRFIFSILRTFPPLVIALIATSIVGIGTLAGTIALCIFTWAIICKMLYEHIETVDMNPYEAMLSLGATKVRAFFCAIVPQILASYFSITLYTLEMNVRNAAILGYVGAGGIGLLLQRDLSLRTYDKVATVILMLFITVLIIENLSRYLRKRLN